MNKRLQKKQGNNFNLIKYVHRQMRKRKGIKHIAYELIPMGEQDKTDFKKEYYPDFSYASHWFIECFPHKVWPGYVIQIYPCTSRGRVGREYSYYRIFSDEDLDYQLLLFNKLTDDMRNDGYYEKEKSYYYDDLKESIR